MAAGCSVNPQWHPRPLYLEHPPEDQRLDSVLLCQIVAPRVSTKKYSTAPLLSVCRQTVVAYLHCRIQIQVPTRILILKNPNGYIVLYRTCSHCTDSDLASRVPCDLWLLPSSCEQNNRQTWLKNITLVGRWQWYSILVEWWCFFSCT